MDQYTIILGVLVLAILVFQVECIDTLAIKLNEQGRWRRINAISVTSTYQNLTNCGGSLDCLIDFNQISGQNTILFSCENPGLYGPTYSSFYGNPSFIGFELPDANLISDATFVLKGTSTGENANITIECLNQEQYVDTILPDTIMYNYSFYYVWDIPLSCFNLSNTNTVTIKVSNYGSDCLAIDNSHMNVRSTFQKINVSSISNTSCNLASDQTTCVDVLNYAYGNSLTATGYPSTTFDWYVPTFQSLSNATVHLKATITANNSQIVVGCLDPSTDLEIGRIWTSDSLPIGASVDYYSAVPTQCFVGFVARLAVYRTASTSLNISLLDLDVETNGRPVPAFAATPSSACGASCLDQINDADGQYYQVCISSQSTFQFLSLDYDTMKLATLELRANSLDWTDLVLTCVNEGFQPVPLGSINITNTNNTYFIQVPASCFYNSDITFSMKNASGTPCIWIDFIRLYTDSAVSPNLALNQHGIEGYTDDVSFTNGDKVDLKISYGGAFSIEIYRIGSEETLVKTAKVSKSYRQDYDDYAFKIGCGWNTTYSFTIPDSWKSGIYTARLIAQNQTSSFDLIFIVREQSPGKQGIKTVVLASVNTWLAYNEWGGASFYRYYGPDGSERKFRPNIPSNFLAIIRPNPAAYSSYGMVKGEQFVLSWLEQRAYDFAVLADTDVHWNPNILDHYDTVIINTHGEYYSAQMYNALQSFLDNGKNLLNLGADAVYWKVTWNGSICENRKDSTIHIQTGERGGLWRDLGRPESALLGAQFFTVDGISSSPFQVVNVSDFVYQNSGLNDSDFIGKGGCSLFGGSAAGWELDFITSYSPNNTVLVAHGMQMNDSGNMVYYFHPAGGIVYDAGSLTYGGSLIIDDHLTVVLMNVLKAAGVVSGLEFFELLPVTSVKSASSDCTIECLQDINHSNHYLDYSNTTIPIVCDMYGMSNPTSIYFHIPDTYQKANLAWLNLDAASQSITVANVTCLHPSTLEVIVPIATGAVFETTPIYPRYDLPIECIKDGTVLIQITKEEDTDCLWVDFIGVTVQGPTNQDNSSDGLSGGLIALIVICGLIGVVIASLGPYFYIRQRRHRTAYVRIE